MIAKSGADHNTCFHVTENSYPTQSTFEATGVNGKTIDGALCGDEHGKRIVIQYIRLM